LVVGQCDRGPQRRIRRGDVHDLNLLDGRQLFFRPGRVVHFVEQHSNHQLHGRILGRSFFVGIQDGAFIRFGIAAAVHQAVDGIPAAIDDQRQLPTRDGGRKYLFGVILESIDDRRLAAEMRQPVVAQPRLGHAPKLHRWSGLALQGGAGDSSRRSRLKLGDGRRARWGQ